VANTPKIISHHRSLKLAERHLRSLGKGWSIESRRTATGKFSPRGHTFTFIFKEENVFEWIVGFTYSRSGRSFDIIVTTVDETEAYSTAIDFLQHDREGQRIARSGLKGWEFSVARGKRTNREAGLAEYRSKSRSGKGTGDDTQKK